MKRKTLAGLIAIVAIVTAVMFAGCIEEEASVSTPSPTAIPFEKIEELATIKVGGGTWDNWDADIDEKNP